MVVIISTDKSGKPRDEVGRIWLEDSNDRISAYERGEKEWVWMRKRIMRAKVEA